MEVDNILSVQYRIEPNLELLLDNAMQVLELLSAVLLEAVSTTAGIRRAGRRVTKPPNCNRLALLHCHAEVTRMSVDLVPPQPPQAALVFRQG